MWWIGVSANHPRRPRAEERSDVPRHARARGDLRRAARAADSEGASAEKGINKHEKGAAAAAPFLREGHKPLPLYYKAAATVARLASACYTAEDAVDWFPPLTA